MYTNTSICIHTYEFSLQSRKDKERGMSTANFKHFGKVSMYFGYEDCFRNQPEDEGLRNLKVKHTDKRKYPQVLVIC